MKCELQTILTNESHLVEIQRLKFSFLYFFFGLTRKETLGYHDTGLVAISPRLGMTRTNGLSFVDWVKTRPKMV